MSNSTEISTNQMNKLLLLLMTACCSLQLGCSKNRNENSKSGENTCATRVAEERNYERINENLANFTIAHAGEDLETFRREKKPVYAISHYKAENQKNNPRPLKKINGKDFYLQSYTGYLKDGENAIKNTYTTRFKGLKTTITTGSLLTFCCFTGWSLTPKGRKIFTTF